MMILWISACRLLKRYPNVLLQWEDFGNRHARPLLEKYQDQICSFNDDIQGTAAVALASIIASSKLTMTKLQDQRIVMLGGGSAGMGIAHHILGAMMQEGMKQEEAKKAFYIVDIQGLVHKEQEQIPAHHLPFAREPEEIAGWTIEDGKKISLLEVVKAVRPTILIGVSAQPGAFTEEVVKTMAQYVERPVIIPLSNPTSKSEAHPSDLIVWTKGKAIIATGSPFDPVFYNGNTYQIAQCNNVSIFPGIGLGVVACKSKKVTDAMFYKAAEILSRHSPMLQDPYGPLFPQIENLRKISQQIAEAVIEIAQKEGLSPEMSPQEIKELLSKTLWTPHY
ncbi:MAG: oxaloacetate-decarboxylating malate dehydrogenase [Rhabdochlamydiaceae bacterium]